MHCLLWIYYFTLFDISDHEATQIHFPVHPSWTSKHLAGMSLQEK